MDYICSCDCHGPVVDVELRIEFIILALVIALGVAVGLLLF